MAALYLNTWKPSILVTAHEAIVTALGATATIKVFDVYDTLLGTIALEATPGTVDELTGELTFITAGREEDAPASGQASYASLTDSAGEELHSLPCQQGATPVAGYCVLNSVSVVEGGIIELISWSVQ